MRKKFTEHATSLRCGATSGQFDLEKNHFRGSLLGSKVVGVEKFVCKCSLKQLLKVRKQKVTKKWMREDGLEMLDLSAERDK